MVLGDSTDSLAGQWAGAGGLECSASCWVAVSEVTTMSVCRLWAAAAIPLHAAAGCKRTNTAGRLTIDWELTTKHMLASAWPFLQA